MCGIVGIVSTEAANQQVYDSLLLLQHRGQDSTGIATADGPTFHITKAKGQVREAFRTRDMRSLMGNMGLGHVRYATKGAAEREDEAQPFYVNAPYGIILVHNGNLTNTRELSDDLFRIDRRHVNTRERHRDAAQRARDRAAGPDHLRSRSTPPRSSTPSPRCTSASRAPTPSSRSSPATACWRSATRSASVPSSSDAA